MSTPTAKLGLREAFVNPRMLICLCIGFASGMPLYVLVSLIPAWLRESSIDLATIGLFSIVGFPYTWKFLWAPFMDRFVPPMLGRRRGWMLVTQVVLAVLLASLSLFDPAQSLQPIVFVVAGIAFFSASQDIVIDAYRREILPEMELGLGNSFHVNAYRLSSLVPGSLGLILADQVPWAIVHWVMAGFMLLCAVITLFLYEPLQHVEAPHTLVDAVVKPFRDFFTRNNYGWALLTLLFVLLYKLGDNMAVALETPFFLDMGFTKTEIGTVAKVSKLWASVVGGFIGGVVMLRLGINRALWIFGVAQIISILGYGALSIVGNELWMLFVAVSLEYLGVGLGTVALLAFMARICDQRFTATQFALLSAVASLPRVAASASTGFIIEAVGYTTFFVICYACAIPGMLLLSVVAPWNGNPREIKSEIDA